MDEKKKITALLLATVMVASVFAMTVSMVYAAPVPAAVTNGTKSTLTLDPAGSNVSEGGYVTDIDFTVEASTSKWQGYYGDVSGGILLGGDTEGIMFRWTWDTSLGGEVFATTSESAPAWGSLESNATEKFTKEITDVWGWTPASASDNATMTLNSTTYVDIAGTTISMNCTAEDALLMAGEGWLSGAVATATPNHKDNFTFVGIINNGNASFDGEAADYEMLVPVGDTVGATEEYYFYVEMS